MSGDIVQEPFVVSAGVGVTSIGRGVGADGSSAGGGVGRDISAGGGDGDSEEGGSGMA